MKKLGFDFETRSGTDIKAGLPRYFSDREAQVLCLAFRCPKTNEIELWHPGMDGAVIAPFLQHVVAGGLVSGWNVMFEFQCWNTLCVPAYGWPKLGLEQCIDTMAVAAAHNLPQALGKCAEVLGLPSDQQKDKRGRYLIQKLCKPRKETKANSERWPAEQDLTWEFYDYCKQDVLVEESVGRKLRPLSDFEQRVWVTTQRINMRGVPVAVNEIQNITQIVELEKERLNRELRTITGHEVRSATSREAMLAWCNSRLATPVDFEDDPEPDDDGNMPNMKGPTVDAVLQRTDLVPEVRRALEIRRTVVQTSTAKYKKMLAIVAPDGTIKNLLVYHGAGTGRWASRGGLNVQNFPRPILNDRDISAAHHILGYCTHEDAVSFFGDETMDAAVSCLRGVIKAPEGFRFLDADYSSVENRVASWIAGQTDKLALFAKGLDEYRQFSSTSLHNVPYDQVTGAMRQMSKSAVLGCMFGQGAKGLIEYSKPFGVDLTPKRSAEIVALYRQEYDKVHECWRQCADAALWAVRTPGVEFAAGDKLTLIVRRNFLEMWLPSGRPIYWSRPKVEIKEVPWDKVYYEKGRAFKNKITENGYLKIEIDLKTKEPIAPQPTGTEYEKDRRPVVTVESVETKTRQWCRHALIGSSIFQSAVQGTARDILTQGIINLEDAGYDTRLLAHDEGLILAPTGFGSAKEVGELMCRPAPWFEDLPLAYEEWEDGRFRK